MGHLMDEPAATANDERNGAEPVKRRRRSAASIQRREEIKAVAVRHFYEFGYHGTDVRKIAAELGVHPTSVTHYFAEKSDLLQEIIDEHVAAMVAHFDAEVAPISNPIVALYEAVRSHAEWAVNNHVTHQVYQFESRHLPEATRADLAERDRAYRGRFVQILQEGQRLGFFRPFDSELVALGIFGMTARLSRMNLGAVDYRASSVVDTLGTLVLSGLSPGRGSTDR
jgi:AcrR family transcriptional regulator